MLLLNVLVGLTFLILTDVLDVCWAGGSLIKINCLLLGMMRRMPPAAGTTCSTGSGASFQRGVLPKMQDTLDQGVGRSWAAWGAEVPAHDAAQPRTREQQER